MHLAFTFKAIRLTTTAVLLTLFFGPNSILPAQTVTTDPPYSVVERGPFYRILQRTIDVTNASTGMVSQEVQSLH
jgi:hypothetical protein